MPGKRRLSAIMFTDIVGYTALMGKNEKHGLELLKKNRRIHKKLIRKYQGTLLKELGDGMLACFPSTTKAVLCGHSIQGLALREDIPLRIGIHEGDVIFESGDVIGDGVNIASRLQEKADPGSVLISGQVHQNIKNKTELNVSSLGQIGLKNVSEPVSVFQVHCDPEESINLSLRETTTPTKKIVRIAGFVILLSLFLFAAWNFLFKHNKITSELSSNKKSIAVIPFDNQSNDQSNQYFCDGVMDAINDHLCKIDGLLVKTRSSVEAFRNQEASLNLISRKLNVKYILRGAVLRSGNRIRITVNLIDAENNQLMWSKPYERELTDIFTITSEIARKVAGEVKVNITTLEKHLIDKRPHVDISTYDVYLQANEYHWDYWLNDNREALDHAVSLYKRALDMDPGFALAWAGLAKAYWDRHYWESFYKEAFLDSGLILAQKAVTLDDQLDEAYYVRSRYNQEKGAVKEAFRDVDRAIALNPNHVLALRQKGQMLYLEKKDYKEGIETLEDACKLEKGRLLPVLLREIGNAYGDTGFTKKEEAFYREALQLDGDSSRYFKYLALNEKDHEKALEYSRKCCGFKPHTEQCYEIMGFAYRKLKNYEEASYYYTKYLQSMKENGNVDMTNFHRIAFVFHEINLNEPARQYFDRQIRFCEESIKKNTGYTRWYGLAYYDLAGIYAYLGDKEKAYTYLNRFGKMDFYPVWLVSLMKEDALFGNLRPEYRFQQIVQTVVSVYNSKKIQLNATFKKE